jgi:hypothetical protein
MGEFSARNFGLLIAYVLPGFVALWGVGLMVEPVQFWLHGPASDGPTVSGFLFVLLGSVAAGMTVSAIRWAVVDSIHHATGLRKPAWDDAGLAQKLQAYQFLIEIHYRYFQFYANTLVALPFSYGVWRFSPAGRSAATAWADAGVLLIELVFIAASRDALSKYYRRTAKLLGGPERKPPMTNGGSHDHQSSSVKAPKPQSAKKVVEKVASQSSSAPSGEGASTGQGTPQSTRR